MSDEQQKQKIRAVVENWMQASARGDVDTVLTLMAEDVVFLLPGRPPMKGRDAFAAASKAMAGKIQVQGEHQVQEIQVAGDYAFCWNHLSVTATPTSGGETMRREGEVLSVFRKESDGRWVLFRDANLLAPK